MIVREAKLLSGSKAQYQALDEAIRTAKFIRNKAIRLWRDEPNVNKARLSLLCKELARAYPFAKKLNSMARQAASERAWNSISSFYRRCREGAKKKGYPQFKKHSRSVEYKTTGWKLSEDCLSINFTDGFKAGKFSLFCNYQTREDLSRLKINRVRVVRRADGSLGARSLGDCESPGSHRYYAQFCFDATRSETGNYTGNVVGIDLGLKYFYKDHLGNATIYPKYLRKAEKRIKKLQRRLSRKFVKGAKSQSKNYHKTRIRLVVYHSDFDR